MVRRGDSGLLMSRFHTTGLYIQWATLVRRVPASRPKNGRYSAPCLAAWILGLSDRLEPSTNQMYSKIATCGRLQVYAAYLVKVVTLSG